MILNETCDFKNLRVLQIPAKAIDMLGKCSCPSSKSREARKSKRKMKNMLVNKMRRMKRKRKWTRRAMTLISLMTAAGKMNTHIGTVSQTLIVSWTCLLTSSPPRSIQRQQKWVPSVCSSPEKFYISVLIVVKLSSQSLYLCKINIRLCSNKMNQFFFFFF